MNIFDEQTDFSFLNITEPKSSVVSKKNSKAIKTEYSTINVTYTITRSDEFKDKVSKSLSGRKQPKELVEKRRIKLIGQKRTPETNALISKSRTGMKLSEEHRRNISLSKKGKASSEETKRKITEGLLRHYALHPEMDKKTKRVMTPAGEFASIKLTCAFFDIGYDTFYRWMKKHPEQFYYITKD